MRHYQKNPSESLLWKYFPMLIVIALMGTLSIFIYWLLTVVAPVATVEANFQVKKALVTAFGVSDLRGLFLPAFRIGIEEKSRNEAGGIVIPSLFLDEPIVFNVDPNDVEAYTTALKKGIAHASSTRLPDNGGLGYYFAHSSSPNLARQYNAVFYLLGKLKGGEKIIVWHEGKPHHYLVTTTKVTVSDDVSFLQLEQYNEESIVLQTCWPPGTTERRLLVFAERSDEIKSESSQTE